MSSFKYNFETTSVIEQKKTVKRPVRILKDEAVTNHVTLDASNSLFIKPIVKPKMLDFKTTNGHSNGALNKEVTTLTNLFTDAIPLETSIDEQFKAMKQRMDEVQGNWQQETDAFFTRSRSPFRMEPLMLQGNNLGTTLALQPATVTNLSENAVPHIEELNKDARKVKLQVDMEFAYKPEEVSIKIDAHRINIDAKHEEGQKIKQEFTETFECPEKMDTAKAQAFIGSGGQLVVCASLASNKDHLTVLESMKRDCPIGGKSVSIITN